MTRCLHVSWAISCADRDHNWSGNAGSSVKFGNPGAVPRLEPIGPASEPLRTDLAPAVGLSGRCLSFTPEMPVLLLRPPRRVRHIPNRGMRTLPRAPKVYSISTNDAALIVS